MQESNRLPQRIPLPGRHFEILQRAQTFEPIDRPRNVALRVNVSEWAEGPVGQFSADIVEFSAGRLRQREKGVALIEGKDLCARIAEPLGGSQPEKRGLAGSRRTDHEGVAQVPYVE